MQAKRGDKISLEIKPKEKSSDADGKKYSKENQRKPSEKDKDKDKDKDSLPARDKLVFHFKISHKERARLSEIEYCGLKTGFYPCLAMSSTGAAVKLLTNSFWISDNTCQEGATVS